MFLVETTFYLMFLDEPDAESTARYLCEDITMTAKYVKCAMIGTCCLLVGIALCGLLDRLLIVIAIFVRIFEEKKKNLHFLKKKIPYGTKIDRFAFDWLIQLNYYSPKKKNASATFFDSHYLKGANAQLEILKIIVPLKHSYADIMKKVDNTIGSVIDAINEV
ncbi:hypothetical protein ACJX0J_030978, partial [Zea mays]